MTSCWARFALSSTLSVPPCPPLAKRANSYSSPHSAPLPSASGWRGWSTPHDPGTLADSAGRLCPFLPPRYRWLGGGDVTVVGKRPLYAGGFANVWVGETAGNRKVAVKSHRRQHICRPIMPVTPNCCGCDPRRQPTSRGLHGLSLVPIFCQAPTFPQANAPVDAGGHALVAGLGGASISSTAPRVNADSSFDGVAPGPADTQWYADLYGLVLKPVGSGFTGEFHSPT